MKLTRPDIIPTFIVSNCTELTPTHASTTQLHGLSVHLYTNFHLPYTKHLYKHSVSFR